MVVARGQSLLRLERRDLPHSSPEGAEGVFAQCLLLVLVLVVNIDSDPISLQLQSSRLTRDRCSVRWVVYVAEQSEAQSYARPAARSAALAARSSRRASAA